MTSIEFLALIPLVIVAAASIIIMLSIAVKRSHVFVNLFSLFSLGAAFLSLFFISVTTPITIIPLIILDKFSYFFFGLIIAASFFVVLFSFNYFKQQKEDKEEFYILLLIATLGASLLAACINFISFFLSLEILSVSLYTLISYLRTNKNALEAGVKYLILAAASAAFLLFGMALVYAGLGTMMFNDFAVRIAASDTNVGLAIAGFSMIIIGVGFKLGVVPFHLWTPDVYQGASSPVTSFIATASKAGMFAVLLRLFISMNVYQYQALVLTFTIIAAASMLIGNLLALRQNNVKRILAYSSIAHLGYLLVAFLAAGSMGVQASTFYFVSYFITTLGAFGIITILSVKEREAENIEDYRGLFWSHPTLAAVFTAILFSLAGIPLTVGFIGKYYLLTAGVNSSLWFLVITLVVSSVIGLYYYLRIVTSMFAHADETNGKLKRRPFTFGGSIALTVLTVLLIWYGFFPEGILSVIKSIAGI